MTESEYRAAMSVLLDGYKIISAKAESLLAEFKKDYPLKKGDKCRCDSLRSDFIFDRLESMGVYGYYAAYMYRILPDGTIEEQESVTSFPLTKI